MDSAFYVTHYIKWFDGQRLTFTIDEVISDWLPFVVIPFVGTLTPKYVVAEEGLECTYVCLVQPDANGKQPRMEAYVLRCGCSLE